MVERREESAGGSRPEGARSGASSREGADSGGASPEGARPGGASPKGADSAGGARPGTFQTTAEAALFGFDPSPARAEIVARSRGWRVGGAARIFAAFVVVAPFLAIFPPHAVWFIGALSAGGLLARRRYVERYTLVEVEARCPKCDAPLSVKPSRLRVPHPLPCDVCHHESSLRLPEGTLQAHAVE